MKRKILTILKWAILSSFLIFTLSFVSKKQNEQQSKGTIINIDSKHKFINEDYVRQLLINNNIFTDSSLLKDLDFRNIESLLKKNTAVKTAEVYEDNGGYVNIAIQQRQPLIRVFTIDLESFYVDKESKFMPLCDHYVADVVVVSGNLLLSDLYVYDTITCNYLPTPCLNELIDFVSYINSHSLWRYQVEQIYYNDEKDYEIVPRVGNNLIILGNLENFQYKLEKLEALYKKGFNFVNFNLYSSINLKYTNQIICKKK